MEEVIEGYNYKIIAGGGIYRPRFHDGVLETPWTVLELDASYGLFGDSISGLLLAPITKATLRAWNVIMAYRARVLAEEFMWVKDVLGSIAKISSIKPELYPLLRMRKLSSLYCDIYVEVLQHLGLEALSYARTFYPNVSTYTTLLGRILRLRREGITCDFSRAPLLENPWSLVRLPEGLINDKGLDYESIAAPHVGEPVVCSRVSLLHSIIKCTGPRGSLAVKDYKVSSFKWIPAFLASALVSRYQRDPRDRAATELWYSRVLRSIVKTPKILSLHINKENVLASREYIEGEPVLNTSSSRAWREAGRLLARIHNLGYTLGDANPSNFIKSEDGMALIDLEQARRASEERIAWDIITVIAYSHLLNVNPRLIREFLEGYVLEAENTGTIVREFSKLKYWIPYIIIPLKLPEAVNIIRAVFTKPFT